MGHMSLILNLYCRLDSIIRFRLLNAKLTKKRPYTLGQLFKAPWCNGHPSRAPRIGAYSFPLCWRCLAIVWGGMVTAVLAFPASPSVALFLMSPAVIDGATQIFTDYESTNFRRVGTGLFAGIGYYSLIYSVGVL